MDIDFEMARYKNSLLYHTFVQIIANRDSASRSAISGQ